MAAPPLGKRAFEPAQDSVGLVKGYINYTIRAWLRRANGVDAQLRRIARRPDMGDIAIAEINPHAVEHINSGDGVEAQGRCEKPR